MSEAPEGEPLPEWERHPPESARRRRVVNIRDVHIIHLAAGAVRVGLWCDEHALPHAYEVDLHALCDDGPHPMGVYRACDNDETPPPDPKV